MIFLDKYTVKPRIPRNWKYPVTNLELVLFNRFTNNKHRWYDVLLDETEIYYILKDLDLKELPTGEYEYTLTDKKHNIVVSKGLIQIGELGQNNTEYNTTTKYIEYKR